MMNGRNIHETRFQKAAQSLFKTQDRLPAPRSTPHSRMSADIDITWLTECIAVGGGIWNAERMAEVAEAGITHIVDMQLEFDDSPLAQAHGIEVLWNAIDDDFLPKPAGVFRLGVDFCHRALETPESRIFIHCAAGIHRAPMMALALLCSMGWDLDKAIDFIETKRPVAEFLEVYVDSVKRYLRTIAPLSIHS